MDVETPYSNLDDAGPALATIWRLIVALFHDPIFLALCGCALVAWLTWKGPTLRDPPNRTGRVITRNVKRS